MKKRGQFFLIAALIIIVIIIGLGTIYNSAVQKVEDVEIYDLSEEISFETSQVIDRGVLESLSDSEINLLIENLTLLYAEANPSSDFLFVYGNKTQVSWLRVNSTETGSVGLNLGGPTTEIITEEQGIIYGTSVPEEDKIEVVIDDGVTEEFDVRDGKNFFIVIEKVNDGDTFIAT